MNKLWMTILALGVALPALAQEPGQQPSFEGQGGCGTVNYLPAKVMTCAHGSCWWHDAGPAQAYLFTDPVFCTGAHCPPGTIGPKGLRQ
jgi:hypothetical protein